MNCVLWLFYLHSPGRSESFLVSTKPWCCDQAQIHFHWAGEQIEQFRVKNVPFVSSVGIFFFSVSCPEWLRPHPLTYQLCGTVSDGLKSKNAKQKVKVSSLFWSCLKQLQRARSSLKSCGVLVSFCSITSAVLLSASMHSASKRGGIKWLLLKQKNKKMIYFSYLVAGYFVSRSGISNFMNIVCMLL